ncbi:unnamed protein product [Trichobilharzia szidati]|nr:unnamed protein product [Trichobilharzia szidati]
MNKTTEQTKVTSEKSDRKLTVLSVSNRMTDGHHSTIEQASSIIAPRLSTLSKFDNENANNTMKDQNNQNLLNSSPESNSLSVLSRKWSNSSISETVDSFKIDLQETQEGFEEKNGSTEDTNHSDNVNQNNKDNKSVPNSPIDINLLQVNMNALCTESRTGTVEASSIGQAQWTPSFTTGVTTTATTCASSRLSRTSVSLHPPYSPNRTTPASTPSRRQTTCHQISLLETAKMLLSESSKLESITPIRDHLVRPLNDEQMESHHYHMLGKQILALTVKRSLHTKSLNAVLNLTSYQICCGDAGEGIGSDRIKASIERRRYQEAVELQKQIHLLNETTKDLYNRAKEKTRHLNSLIQDTLSQMKSMREEKLQQRNLKSTQKRKITRELFLRQLRHRHIRKQRLRAKLGVTAGSRVYRVGQHSVHEGLPTVLLSKEISEAEALKQWEINEDLRDQAEANVIFRMEENALHNATVKLKCLKEKADRQLGYLEDLMQFGRNSTGEMQENETGEINLSRLRVKHLQLVTLLNHYGIMPEDVGAYNFCTKEQLQIAQQNHLVNIPSDSGNVLPNLWDELQEDQLHKYQKSALCHFQKMLEQVNRTNVSQDEVPLDVQRRRQWHRDSEYLNTFSRMITPAVFSYFDYWKQPLPSLAMDVLVDFLPDKTSGRRSQFRNPMNKYSNIRSDLKKLSKFLVHPKGHGNARNHRTENRTA